jgi:hypothetical protein
MMQMWLAVAAIVTLAAAALVWMWARVQALPEQPQPIIRQGIPMLTREKVDANIARFTRAIEQNTTGGDKLKELKANLKHWKALDAALRERGE